jgi:phytol kinase
LGLLQDLIVEFPWVVIVGGISAAGLWMSNTVYDLGVPHYISRKIGHFAGGFSFLVATFKFSSAFWPIVISVAFGVLLIAARLLRPETFRGVGGAGREENVMAEVWFPWVAVPVFVIAWAWLSKQDIALACLLFMAWGDGVTGLLRWQIYHKPVKGLWGSLAMLCVCLIISWALIKPFWVGAIGSIAATVTEWAFGDLGKFKHADDNWTVPLVSMCVILLLLFMTRNI